MKQIPKTDGMYNLVDGEKVLGRLSKVTMTRSTHLWVADPVMDGPPPTSFRIGYKTRRDARNALLNFVYEDDKEYGFASYIGSEPHN